MNDFLTDLWSDLREKRLWPVAALLLVGLIAVPVVLSKPTEEPPAVTASAPEAPSPDVAKGLAALTVAEDDAGEGSTLDVFDPSNPFKPPKDIIANSDESTDSGTGTGSTDTGTAPSGTPASTDTGTGTGTGGTTSTPVETKTIRYRFVIDGGLTVNGKKKQFESLRTVGLLPSEKNPLLAYIGVGKNVDNAVFLVDDTLIPDADGDGKCKPSRAKCAFLFLGPGETQKFTTADGDTYKLRISQIRKVEVTDVDKSSERRDGATGAITEPTDHRFSSPLLTDLVTGPDDLSDDGQTSP